MQDPLAVTGADLAFQQCIAPACRAQVAVDQALVACPQCGELLDVQYDWGRLPVPKSLAELEA